MNDQQHNEKQCPKRLYRKPQVIQVPLRPDEAVLGGCKTSSTGGGPGGTDCHTVQCFSLSS